MSTDDKPRSLEVLRGHIDAIDRDILQLLAKRMAIVAELAGVKRDQGVRVRDARREREIISDRRERAEQLGLSAELIESIFRLIMWASRDYQASLKAEVPVDMQPKTVAIIGGHGGIGRRMAQLFTELGHTVLISDVDTALTPERAAQSADGPLIALPIAVTEQVS